MAVRESEVLIKVPEKSIVLNEPIFQNFYNGP